MSLSGVGIVTALYAEARALTSHHLSTGRVIPLLSGDGLYVSGMGPDAAREAALALIEEGATALAVFGVAGALAPALRSGMLICPESIRDERGHDYICSPPWRQALCEQLRKASLAPGMHGCLLSVETTVSSPASKTALRDRHMAVAVDMESAAVAQIAAERHLPFVALRAIVDERDDEIPDTLQAAVNAWGQPRLLPLLAALGRHPSLIPRLPRLATRMTMATRALRQAAVVAGPGLGRGWLGAC